MKRKQKKEFGITAISICIFFACIAGMLSLLVFRFKETSEPSSVGSQGVTIDPNPIAWEDGIYGSHTTEIDNARPSFTDRDVEPYCSIGNFFLALSSWIEDDMEAAYGCLAFPILDGLGSTYTFNEFSTYLDSLRKRAGSDAKLVFQSSQFNGSYYVCKLSFVGMRPGDRRNLVYDYDNVIKISFSVFTGDTGFTYLPFDKSQFGLISNFGTSRMKYNIASDPVSSSD